jgi:hypothetical protein
MNTQKRLFKIIIAMSMIKCEGNAICENGMEKGTDIGAKL